MRSIESVSHINRVIADYNDNLMRVIIVLIHSIIQPPIVRIAALVMRPHLTRLSDLSARTRYATSSTQPHTQVARVTLACTMLHVSIGVHSVCKVAAAAVAAPAFRNADRIAAGETHNIH